MTVRYCGLPPLDASVVSMTRGYGVGWSASGSSSMQLHAGEDFAAGQGTPVLAPVAGRVARVSRDARAASGMRGYGNAILLEHSFTVPGLPKPFWTFYAHLRDEPTLPVGAVVAAGDLLGYSGRSTNGRFGRMPPHLHFEVRTSPSFGPGSYERETVDPDVLWRGLGLERVGARPEQSGAAQPRMNGGRLVVLAGGPSDCRHGERPRLAGLGSTLDAYVPPRELDHKYREHGTSTPSPVEDFAPPDYASVEQPEAEAEAAAASRLRWAFVVAGLGAAGVVVWLSWRRR